MRPSHRNALDRTLVVVCRCLGAAAVLVCLAALTPLPNYLARSLQAEPRLGPADAIVVLGSGIEPRAVRRILLVTDSEHLPRAVALFERAGLEVLPAPADSVSPATEGPGARLELLRRLSQELMARLYYRLAGYL